MFWGLRGEERNNDEKINNNSKGSGRETSNTLRQELIGAYATTTN